MGFRKLYFFLIIIGFFISIGASQSIQFNEQSGTFRTLDNFWNDFKHISTSTFSPAGHANWKLLSGIGLTSILLFGADMEFNEEYALEKEYGPWGIPEKLGNIGVIYNKPGTLYFTLGLAGTLYGTGRVFNDYKLLQTTNLMVRSLIITGIFTTALKVIVGRERPYVGNNSQNFKPFNFKFDSDYMSMPSGHTSSIFAMMTVIAKQYDSWYVKIPTYTFAVSVAMQRMNNRKHWGSDLLIGGILGYLVGSDVVRRQKHRMNSYSLQPIINGSGVGFAIQF